MYRLIPTNKGMKLLNINDKKPKVDKSRVGKNETIDEMDIADFNEEKMGIFGINVNIQRNISLFVDNLKPVQRRVLFVMAELGLTPKVDHKGTAKVVGDTLAKYHPHGDMACYGALIYMSQPWRHLLPLVDIDGNYGNASNSDAYASSRYVKCRLTKFAMDCYFSEWDLKSKLVNMKRSFDGESMEPIYLPTRYPVFLSAWGSGMGYGLATTSPGFAPQDAFATVIELIDNPDAKFVLYPEDPLGCTIMDKEVFKTFVDYKPKSIDDDNLKFRVRSTYTVKDNFIIIHNTPYGVEPVNIYDRIVELVQKKKLDGLEDMEMRTVRGKIPQLGNKEDSIEIKIEIKKGYDPHIIMDALYKQTDLQKTFPLICNYVDNYKTKNYAPVMYSLRESILIWIELRRKLLRRKYRLDIISNTKRKTVLDALLMMFEKGYIDDLINIMRKNVLKDVPELLIKKFGINDYQAKQISEMRVSSLAIDSKAKYVEELAKLIADIDDAKKKLTDKAIDDEIKKDMREGIEKYSRIKQSKVISGDDTSSDGNTYTVCLTNTGYVKKLNQKDDNSFGKVMEDSELVFIETGVKATSKVIGFAADGKILGSVVSKIKESKLDGIGTNFSKDKNITFVSGITVDDNSNDASTIICITKNGTVKRSKAKDFFAAASDSKGMKLSKDDAIVSVLQSYKNDDKILIYSKNGKAILYGVNEVTTTSRVTAGVIGIKLEPDDTVAGAKIIKASDAFLITVSTRGELKKFSFESNLRSMKRGDAGIDIVSKNEIVHNVVAVTAKDTMLRVINSKNMDGEYVDVSTVPLKTRISSGDKLINARKGVDLVFAEK